MWKRLGCIAALTSMLLGQATFYPSSSVNGASLTPSGFQLYDGTHYFAFSPAFQCSVAYPTFTWLNQVSATETATGGQLQLTQPSSVANAYRTTAIGANTTLIAAVVPVLYGGGSAGNNNSAGVFFYESGTSKIVTFQYGYNNAAQPQIGTWAFTSPTTFSTVITSGSAPLSAREYLLFRLQVVGSNLVFSVSGDGGANYIQILSEAKTAHFTTAPDNWGYFVAGTTGNINSSVLLSWATS